MRVIFNFNFNFGSYIYICSNDGGDLGMGLEGLALEGGFIQSVNDERVFRE